jgi:hypothetical protein
LGGGEEPQPFVLQGVRSFVAVLQGGVVVREGIDRRAVDEDDVCAVGFR